MEPCRLQALPNHGFLDRDSLISFVEQQHPPSAERNALIFEYLKVSKQKIGGGVTVVVREAYDFAQSHRQAAISCARKPFTRFVQKVQLSEFLEVRPSSFQYLTRLIR
jgi:hypothetical protein